jgi:hypothetical protein
MMKVFQGVMMAVLLCLLSGCSIKYSASGASIDPEAKTVNVKFIDNRAPIVNPMLSPKITESLRNKIQSQTKLTQVSENEKADYEFRGTITGYSFSNAAVVNVDQAATSRLNVTITMTFIKRIGDKKGFSQQSFSRSADFPANQLPSSVENKLLNGTIIDQLVDDIFNRAFANW